jgi:hypothetical protein
MVGDQGGVDPFFVLFQPPSGLVRKVVSPLLAVRIVGAVSLCGFNNALDDISNRVSITQTRA